MPIVGKLIYPKSVKNTVKEVNFFKGHPVTNKPANANTKNLALFPTIKSKIGKTEI